jgi:hypothetical protein
MSRFSPWTKDGETRPLDVSAYGLTDVAEAFVDDDGMRAMVVIDASGWRASLSLGRTKDAWFSRFSVVDPEGFTFALGTALDIGSLDRASLLEWTTSETARLLRDLIHRSDCNWKIELRPAEAMVFLPKTVASQRVVKPILQDPELLRRWNVTMTGIDDDPDGAKSEYLMDRVDLIHPWRRSTARKLLRHRPWMSSLAPIHLSAVIVRIVQDGLDAGRLTAAQLLRIVALYDTWKEHDRFVERWTAGGIEVADRFLVRSPDNTLTSPLRTLEYVAFVSMLPASWLPKTEEENDIIFAMARIVSSSWGFGADDIVPLMQGCRGRWAEFAERVGLDISRPHEFETRLGGIGDMILDIEHRLVRPLLRRPGERSRLHDIMAGSVRFGRTAYRLATQDGGLLLLLRKSEVWHERQRHLPTLDGMRIDKSWPALTQPFTASNGVVVEFLTDPKMLEEEGEAMRHCVGTYARSCASGISHIASIRRIGEDGVVRLSTIEIHTKGTTPTIRQHQGTSNTHPPKDADRASLDWTAAVLSGKLDLNEDALASREVPESLFHIPDDGSPGDWKGILQPGLARMNWGELIEEIERTEDAVVAEIHRKTLEDEQSLSGPSAQ